jgi:hypothetical protein
MNQAMNLKYKSQVSEFENCDLDKCSEQDRQSFRWVFENINDARNFKPRFLLDETIPKTSCIGWALSFFETQEMAKKRLLGLTKNKELIFKKLGTHIAVGQLTKTDGISDNSNDLGHFSHFEYEDINLESKFKIIEQVAS